MSKKKKSRIENVSKKKKMQNSETKQLRVEKIEANSKKNKNMRISEQKKYSRM